MNIISENQYLKIALKEFLSLRSNYLINNINTLVLDFTSHYKLHTISWSEYKKIIILTNDITDALLFNNARISAPIHYIHIDDSLDVIFSTLTIALQNSSGRGFKQMLTLRKDLLSNRQFIVLSLTANGLSLPQISLVLGLPTKLLSGYRTSALKRLNKRLSLLTFNKLQVLTVNQSMGNVKVNPEDNIHVYSVSPDLAM